MRILLTRDADASAALGRRLAALGHDPVALPLTHHIPIDGQPLPTEVAAVLLTSPAAARFLSRRPEAAVLRRCPLFAVGERTAEAASRTGFVDVRSATGDGAALVRLVSRALQPGARVLYPAAADRARDIEGELKTAGIKVLTRVIYEARPVETLAPEALRKASEQGIDAALHFSRRAAELYVALAASAKRDELITIPQHVCLSDRVAEPLRAAGAAKVHVAETPDEPALLRALAGIAPARQEF